VRRADNLTTFMCRLCTNLGASTSWTPQGLSKPVMGLLYLLPLNLDRPPMQTPNYLITVIVPLHRYALTLQNINITLYTTTINTQKFRIFRRRVFTCYFQNKQRLYPWQNVFSDPYKLNSSAVFRLNLLMYT
jgi:hypothetical protein